MWRALLLPLLLPLFSEPPLTAACPCVIQFGVCDEARQSDAVFIGTVEAVAPPFLDPYARSKAMASVPGGEMEHLRADSSPEALEGLKKIYLDMFTGLPDYSRAQIVDARTQGELEAAVEALQALGRFARFRVRTMFKRETDDDDALKAGPAAGAETQKDDDEKDTPQFLEVWTGSGDCGIDFLTGETYLVYAAQDEDSGRLQTSTCMRTRRLSEEKGDLGFLYFLQNAPKASTRLDGFVSTNFTDQSLPRYEESVSTPSPGAVVELDTGTGLLYAQSDTQGHFSFDGLKAGDYRLSLLSPGFPKTPRSVVLSRAFHTDGASCARQILVVPAHSGP